MLNEEDMNLLETTRVECPYCGETIYLSIDCSVRHQEYIEDCQVCCCPIDISIAIDAQGLPVIAVKRQDD